MITQNAIPLLSSILPAIGWVYKVYGPTDREVGAVRYDSRDVRPGDLFVALNGRDDRGGEFIEAAVQAGAHIVVVEAAESVPAGLTGRKSDTTVIVVDDARRAMADIAHVLAGNPGERLKLLGVTGTNGKTTVTWMLRQLLNACGERVGVIGTLGKVVDTVVPTGYTTPESPELAMILAEMVDAGMTAVAMEVSSHALQLERVASLEFAAAAFTNLTQDHLDFHHSMDEYLEVKKRLFDELPAGHPAVVNVDDPAGEAMVQDTDGIVYRYGAAEHADLRIADVRLSPDGSRWKLVFSEQLGGGRLFLETKLLGGFNVWNVTAAFGMGLALGFDRARLVAAVDTLQPVPGRMQSIPIGHGATAVVDYAHTPDALENVLSSLREISGGTGRITVVFGCGGDRDRTKRPVMGSIAARLADRVILTSDNPRSEDPEAIIDDIVVGIDTGRTVTGQPVERQADRAAAIALALDAARPGDLVLIAGKGHEDYQIIGTERRHFSDAEVVTEMIRQRSRS